MNNVEIAILRKHDEQIWGCTSTICPSSLMMCLHRKKMAVAKEEGAQAKAIKDKQHFTARQFECFRVG